MGDDHIKARLPAFCLRPTREGTEWTPTQNDGRGDQSPVNRLKWTLRCFRPLGTSQQTASGWNTSGCLSVIEISMRAAPEGSRLPCSQLRRVLRLTPSMKLRDREIMGDSHAGKPC